MRSAFRPLMDGRPAPQGLYDPRNEHDACGVGLRRRPCTGAAEPRHRRAGADRAAQPRAPRRHRRRARHRRRRRASCSRSRTPSCARSPASRCPPPGAYAVGIAFLPADAERARPRPSTRSSGSPPRRASTVLGWRDVPVAPELLGADRPVDHAALPPALRRRRRRRASTGIALDRLAFVLRKRAEREAERLLPVAVGPHPRLQGHADHRPARAVLPRPVRPSGSPPPSRWCTPASPPTPSRPGRWPTRTASSRTTARSTPSRATATGCGPASRCWPATLIPGDLERLFPICTPGRLATRPPSTRCSSCCTSAAARCRTPC